jgi:hypothetical protein
MLHGTWGYVLPRPAWFLVCTSLRTVLRDAGIVSRLSAQDPPQIGPDGGVAEPTFERMSAHSRGARAFEEAAVGPK